MTADLIALVLIMFRHCQVVMVYTTILFPGYPKAQNYCFMASGCFKGNLPDGDCTPNNGPNVCDEFGNCDKNKWPCNGYDDCGGIPYAQCGPIPVVNGTNPPVVNGTNPPVVNGTNPPVVNGTNPPVVNGTNPPVVNGTNPPVQYWMEPSLGNETETPPTYFETNTTHSKLEMIMTNESQEIASPPNEETPRFLF